VADNVARTSRRCFLGAGARLIAGSWALGAASFSTFPGAEPLPARVALGFGQMPPSTEPAGINPNTSSPLGRALDRFYRPLDRFACERGFRVLTLALEELHSALRSGGAGLQRLLSPRFQGLSPQPARETVLRQDGVFRVSRGDWSEPAVVLDAARFSADVSHWLEPHAPLTLADLDCLGVSEFPATVPAGRHRLRSRIRFELAGGASDESSADGVPFGRWQASGEWEIEWEQAANAAAGASAAPWLIAAWRPVEALMAWGPHRVFADVTSSAFGADPSYGAHLLRDTNYWRTVLDTASGIDIFGNCGVSVGDADGDGRDEIYLCQPQGLPNRLYRQSRPGVFEDVAAKAGVDLLDATSMALFADVLNRGRQDLILITQSSPLLFLNEGRGRFKLARNAFPEGEAQAALTGAAMADYDGDGFLDLYVCSYAYFQGQGALPLPAPYYDARNGPGNHLYRNCGDGRFEDATDRSGLNRGNDRFSFACAWGDIDDDGWPDLVVANDFGRNNLYRNRGDGTFEDRSDTLAGYGSGMSSAFADLDGDGSPDLYVGNMWTPAGLRVTADPDFVRRFAATEMPMVRQFAMGNALYRRDRGRGAGDKYMQVPEAAGASKGRWAWCSDSFDLENDGHPDLYVVNGFFSSADAAKAPLDAYLWEEVVALSPQASQTTSDYRAAWSAIFELAHRGHPWNGNQRNVVFLNLGDGSFADISAVSGLDYRDDGRAFAVLDYDGDGDADLVIHSRTGPQLRLLRNDVAGIHHSLALRLTAARGNRDAIGARVEVETASGRQVRWLASGSGFLAQHSKELVFGLGPERAASVVRVRWPQGSVIEYRDLEAGFRYRLVEGETAPQREPLEARATRAGDSDLRDAPPPLAAAPPSQFSAWLVDPLPLPPLPVFSLPRGGGYAEGSSRGTSRRLVWLWDASDPAASGLPAEASAQAGLEPFLSVQKQFPARLIVWSGEPPESLPSQLTIPFAKADDRLRLFCTTVLAYLFDRRRAPAFPTGLLLEERGGSSGREAGLGSQKLVRVYWGGADADEILKDGHQGGPTGIAALPFPGQARLCSFTRDTRVLGAALATAALDAEAEPYLAAAVAANPEDADAAYNLALVRRRLGQRDLALASLRTALTARSHFPEAENLLGVLLAQAGDSSAAREHLEKATREAPDFAEAWNNLGYLQLAQGDLASSRAAVEKALALAPDFPEALNNLGIISARQGNTQAAAELFRRVLAAHPDNEEAANNLGVLEAKQGETREAIATLKSVLDRNPEAASVVLNLARLELSAGQSAEARQLLEGWLRRHPNDATARELLAKTGARD
jgi:Flp pilus assembly protein TadD